MGLQSPISPSVLHLATKSGKEAEGLFAKCLKVRRMAKHWLRDRCTTFLLPLVAGSLGSRPDECNHISSLDPSDGRKPEALLPSAIAQAAGYVELSALEGDMFCFLNARRDGMEAAKNGLGAIYTRRLDMRQVYSGDDRRLLQVLASGFAQYATVWDVGSGCGQLGLSLAALGRKVVCVEASKGRYDCMMSLKSALHNRYPAIARNSILVHGVWPGVLKQFDVSQSLFIAADFVSNSPHSSEQEAISGLKLYKGAIIDTAHFIRPRLRREERDAFLAELFAQGFSRPEPLIVHDPENNSEFVFLKARL